MRPPIIRAFLGDDEIHVDLFAGGGGASLGAAAATGRSPDIAINHSPEAIAMHAANHPTTKHYTSNVYEVDPRRAAAGRPVALLWLSPDCTHHSKAKGGKPRQQKIRGLAWAAIPWAQHCRPRVIVLENVEEWLDWGPVDRTTGQPIKARRGQTFRAWKRKLESFGYLVEWRLLRACDYGAPTTRRRLFLIARCDGKPIRWPEPTHAKTPSVGQLELGAKALKPHRTAAEIIDWSIPCPSIFDRDRPLADKTLARIARGIRKYVLESARPFVIAVNHGGVGRTDHRVHDLNEPMPTVTGGSRGGHALVSALVVKAKTHGGGGNDAMPADEPLRTITASKRGEFALVSPTLFRVDHGDVDKSGKRRGQGNIGLEDPLPTVCAGGGQFGIAVPYLVHRSNGERVGQAPRIYDVAQPLGTIVAQGQKHAVCAAFLARHYGGHENSGHPITVPVSTITTQDHHAVVVCAAKRIHDEDDANDRKGRDRGETRRHDLETDRLDRPADGPAKDGDEVEARLPAGSGARPGTPVPRDGAPLGLDIDQRRDLNGTGRESQGRQQAQQPPEQPRAANSRRQSPPRLPHRVAQENGYAGGSCGSGSESTIVRDVVLGDREATRNLADDGVQGGETKIAAHLVRYNGDRPGAERVAQLGQPLGTVDTANRFALVSAFLARYNGQSKEQPVTTPIGTLDTTDRYALVTVTIDGEEYAIVDIGMRMLTPRELFRAQGFGDSYIIDPVGPNGKPLTKTAQIRACGNSVPPQLATAIVVASFGQAVP